MRGSHLFRLLALALIPGAAWAQGNPLGPEFRVNTYTTDAQTLPAVASFPSGGFVVAWQSYGQDSSLLGVFAQRYSPGGAPVGPEFRVNTYTTSHQAVPSVATDPSGNFVVVWWSTGQDGSNNGVFAQRYSTSGSPLGAEFRVSTATLGHQYRSAVAADAAGNFVVVWASYDGSGPDMGIFGQRYASSGVPVGSEFRINTYTTFQQTRPAVAADGGGNFVVVWESITQDGSFFGVFGQRFASTGSPAGPEFRVNQYTTNDQHELSVAADAAGNFVVSWGSEAEVFARRYSGSGAPLGSEFRVNGNSLDYQGEPSVAADPSGNFVIVWYLIGTGLGNVMGQRYDSVGAPLGPVFAIETYPTGKQWRPAVASDAAGRFVVVWQSYPQDGSFNGIFGQRFDSILPVELTGFRID
jgi:hypothetical protein